MSSILVLVTEDWLAVRHDRPEEEETAIITALEDDGFVIGNQDAGFMAAFELGAELATQAITEGEKVFFFDSEFFWAVIGIDEEDVKARIRMACEAGVKSLSDHADVD